MADLDQVAPSSALGHTVDLGWYRMELEDQRRFRLDQLAEQAIPMDSRCLRCQLSKESENPHLHPWRTGTIRPTSPSRPLRDIVDVWGEDSFPASDPPANW